MASNQRNISIPWPFAPNRTDLNNDTSLLKLVAMLTMFIDHAGAMLFPQYRVMRVIGRIAFPIYAYCIAAGCVYSRNILNYLKRIVLMALICQPLYAVSMGHTVSKMYAVSFAEEPFRAVVNFYLQSWVDPSILVTLAIGLIIIWTIRERHLILTLAMAVLVWKIYRDLDYGWRGQVLIVLFYLLCSKWWLSLPAVLSFMVWWGLQSSGYTLFDVKFGIQMFAVLSLPLIYIHTKSKIRLHKSVFYLFYPAHLAIILVLDQFVMK